MRMRRAAPVTRAGCGVSPRARAADASRASALLACARSPGRATPASRRAGDVRRPRRRRRVARAPRERRASAATTLQPARRPIPNAPIPVPPSDTPPAGRRLSANQVLAIAARLPKMKAVRAEIPRLLRRRVPEAPLPLAGQLLLQERQEGDRAGDHRRPLRARARTVDGLPGRVDDGARLHGRVRAPRQRAVHLAAAVRCCSCCRSSTSAARSRCCTSTCSCCCRFSVSLAFFNHAHIYQSVPLAYPPLLYLLAAHARAARARGRRRAASRARCACSCPRRGWRSASSS